KEKSMNAKLFLVSAFLLSVAVSANAQNSPPNYPNVDISGVALELNKISRSVDVMNERLKTYLEKNASTNATLSDSRQKIILGIQALTAAEQRVMNLQTFQFDLTTKLNDTRAKLIQTDIDLRPRNIDRSVAFEGTTETEELREARRQKLQ